MSKIETELLFKIAFTVPPPLDLGETPYGRRRIARITGGTFAGPKLQGRVLEGGGDWLLLRRDGVLQLDVRVALETDDNAVICADDATRRRSLGLAVNGRFKNVCCTESNGASGDRCGLFDE